MIKNLNSQSKDPTAAITEIASQLTSVKSDDFVLLFISPFYDLAQIETALLKLLPCRVRAITTGGEINNGKYQDHSIVGAHFKTGESLRIDPVDFPTLSANGELEAQTIQKAWKENIQPQLGHHKTFGLVFLDGLSGKEEAIMSTISKNIDDIFFFGGSAADGGQFQKTSLFDGQKFQSHAGLFLIVSTTLQHQIIKSEYFRPQGEPFVVTGAIPEKRMITEINGYPAAQFYSDKTGIPVDQLSTQNLNARPLMVQVGENGYVRSVMHPNPDGSLSLACAIEEGVVIYLGKQEDIHEHFTKDIKNQLAPKPIALSLLFECFGRKLGHQMLKPEQMEELFNDYQSIKACGFHTYGEQFGSNHINQTLTGVIFYEN